MLRVAYARFMQESNCLSPVETTVDDFRRAHFLEGEALARVCSKDAAEVEGYIKNAELTGALDVLRESRDVEAIPVLSALAIPGGPLTREAFDEIVGRLEEGLRRSGPLDGVVLALHGAMGVRGVLDPDTEIVKAVHRAAPGARVVVTHDLHGNLTQSRVDECDAIVAYRTNPHRDQRAAGRTAARALLSTLRRRSRPTTAWRSLPMILGGGSTVDILPPVRSIFSRLRSLHRDPRVLSASAFMVHPWNSDPRLGWSTIVTTDGEPALAEDLADELAERCWAVRHHQPPKFVGPVEAIRAARDARIARATGVVVMADASDVVSAGAPGESTKLLAALLTEGNDLTSYVPLRDPVVVAELWEKPEGNQVRVSVGGKLDPARDDALEVEGKLFKKVARKGLGRMVVIDTGSVKLVLTEGQALAVMPAFYRDAGLDPWKADIVIVKNFFPFLLFFAPIMRKVIYVRTGGTTDFDAAFSLPFDGPVWPRDPVLEWRTTDARRRRA
jgi:microcystin degradation protein MlrC